MSNAWILIGTYLAFAVGVFYVVLLIKHAVTKVWDYCRCITWAKVPVVAFVSLIAYYGATKGIQSKVKFLYTDVEQRYLIDAGSFVTNDFVRLNFTRMIAPDTANFIVDRYPVSVTNDDDIAAACENVLTTTFEQISIPFDLYCENVTNYHYLCYTTWTPGPSVTTNGVLHLMWQKPMNADTNRIDFVPYRTAIYCDLTKIAPKINTNSLIRTEN